MTGAARDLGLLLLMCLVLYCTGLDTHGVTNWQEAQRVVVAREMQRRAAAGDPDAWIVPRHNGQAYIAKPPLIYLVTVGVAELRGGEVELFDLRLAVALAGTLGVLGTYLVTRGVLRPVNVRWGEAPDRRHIVGARWAAVFLATGVLYFRSARIGELDILMVPSVVGAVGCIWMAWRRYLEKREGQRAKTIDRFGLRAHWPAVLGAALFASAATLTKGPPALMVIALAGYGSIVLCASCRGETRRGASIAGGVGGVAFAAIAAWNMSGAMDVVGVVMIGVMGTGMGVVVARLVGREPAGKLWLNLAHTHPAIVLGVALLAFWWWGSAVSARIGHELAMSLAKEQAENDLNLFTPASPVRNLEALAYGCGVGSLVMLVAAAWWVKFRPSLRASAAGVMVPVAWLVLSFCALSLFGKGVARYLTPVWPAVAMVAGAWLVRSPRCEPSERDVPVPRRWVLLGVACAVLGVGQAWWYARGREVYEHERSPRAIMNRLMRLEERPRFGSFEFYTPALDYYAGAYVQPIVTAQMGKEVAGGPAWSIEELVRDVRENGPMVVLCRDRSLDASLATPVERMKAAGLVVEAYPSLPVFRIDNARTEVRAVRVGGG